MYSRRIPVLHLRFCRNGLHTTPWIGAVAASKGSGAQKPATTKVTADAATSTLMKWKHTSLRTGVVARKRGMTTMWDEFGKKFPVTILQMENCQVTANIKTTRDDKTVYHAVQIGASDQRAKLVTKPMRGHFAKAGVHPKMVVREFPVTPDAHLPIGTTLSAIHFVPGQYVDIKSTSKGFGFTGVMKKWGYSGGTASHGNSKAHRTIGAIGAHQDPGRVWPGRKMAGRKGGESSTARNLYVVRVDSILDLVYVKGCVPGPDDVHLTIRDSHIRMINRARLNEEKGFDHKILPRGLVDLPFPAGTKELAKSLPSIVEGPSSRVTDPFIPRP